MKCVEKECKEVEAVNKNISQLHTSTKSTDDLSNYPLFSRKTKRYCQDEKKNEKKNNVL